MKKRGEPQGKNSDTILKPVNLPRKDKYKAGRRASVFRLGYRVTRADAQRLLSSLCGHNAEGIDEIEITMVIRRKGGASDKRRS